MARAADLPLARDKAEKRKAKAEAEAAGKASGELTDAEVEALYDEHQALLRKLPRDIGRAKREGKLSAAQQRALARADEIERILPQDDPRYQAVMRRRRAGNEAKYAAESAERRTRSEKRLRDLGLAEGDKVERFGISMLPGQPAAARRG